MNTFLLLLLASASAVFGNASAQQVQQLQGQQLQLISPSGGAQSPSSPHVHWTAKGGWRGPSGFDFNQGSREFVAPNDSALTGITGRERSDDPVMLRFDGRKLCRDQSCPINAVHPLRVTPNIDGNIQSQRDVHAGQEHYVTGLRVCSSRSQKIKGIRIDGARIRTDGTLLPTGTREYKRTNCAAWHTEVKCGPRQVVVGLRAFYTEQKGFTGLSIRCGEVS